MFNRLFLKYYADNTTLNPGAGGDVIATDDISGVKHELVKLEFGDPNSATQVSASNPLPVTDAVAEAALASIAAEDFATQTTLAAVLAKLSSDPATQTTLAAILAKLISNPATDTLQTTGNTTLASILAKIIAAPSTEAKQDIIITALNSIDAGTAAALGQALMAASVPVVIASNQSAIPVSGTVTVDTSLLAKEAKQDTQITAEQAIQTAVQIMDDWDESDRAKVNPIVGQAGVQAGAGATTNNTQRVVIATDQGTIPVSVGAVDNTQLYSNTLSVTGAIAGIDTTGYMSMVIQLSGIWVGSIVVEGSNDNSVWNAVLFIPTNEISQDDSITSNGLFIVKATSKFVRLNVIQVTGTITALIYGRTTLSISAADRLSLAMDRGNNLPLYVAEIETKKDIRNALIPSDAPAPIYGFAVGTNSVIFQVDTTGYQSVVVQALTVGSTINIQTSNDGINWSSLLGYNGANIASSTATVTLSGIYEYPALGRFVRGLMAAPNFTNVLVYLRQRPANPFNLSGGGAVNIQSIGGTANAGLAGTIAVSGNIAVGTAPTANPIPLAIDTSGLTRRILTDTSGRLINSLDASGTSRVIGAIPAAASIQNIYSQAVQDTSQLEGQSMIEIMYQILMELKINNQMMSELPLVLAGQAGKFDDPQQYRNDSTLFAVQ